MPRRIRKIHRIARANTYTHSNHPPQTDSTVRAMKTHQSRVVGAIAIAQEIPVQCLAKLAIESQARDLLLFGGLKTKGGIRHAIDSAATDMASTELCCRWSTKECAADARGGHCLPSRSWEVCLRGWIRTPSCTRTAKNRELSELIVRAENRMLRQRLGRLVVE